jgi:predicted RNA-binding protein YlxR (DUF448 family)
MAKKFHQPIRMCSSCRLRVAQNELIRLQCVDGLLKSFEGFGRSFYICTGCLTEEKKVLKALMHQCRSGDKNGLSNKLKEIITDDRKS